MKTLKTLLSSVAILGAMTFATAASAEDPAFDAKTAFEGTCAKCHGNDGKGATKIGDKVRGEGKSMPDLTAPKTDTSKFEAIITNGVPDTMMKGYGSKFKPEEIKALAEYSKAFKK